MTVTVRQCTCDFAAALVLLIAGLCAAQNVTYDTLAGDLPGLVLAKKRPYLVAGDIYVPRGKQVEIQAGAVFLFRNFTGLHVLGKLTASGSQEQPIVFTSENDAEYKLHESPDAAPFDWNGIRIHPDGIGTQLEYCAVLYSVDGLVSETRFIKLDPCVFMQNGNSDLVIEGQKHEVTEQYYRYVLSVDDAAAQGIPADILRDPLAVRRNVTRYSGFGLALGGGAVGVIYAGRFMQSSRRLRKLSGEDIDNLARHSSDDWTDARSRRRNDMLMMWAGWTIMALGASGFAWTFTF
jgi:hypothetical protein